MTLRLLANASSSATSSTTTSDVATTQGNANTANNNMGPTPHSKRVSEVCRVGVSGEKNDEALSLLAFDFVGEYVFRAEQSGAARLDYDRLDLRSDGTYVAKVDAYLVNPSVRTYGNATCMLPEHGTWNAYKVSGQTRIRIRPTTGPARVYAASRVSTSITLARRAQSTTLFVRGRATQTAEQSSPELIQDAIETTRVLPESADSESDIATLRTA